MQSILMYKAHINTSEVLIFIGWRQGTYHTDSPKFENRFLNVKVKHLKTGSIMGAVYVPLVVVRGSFTVHSYILVVY